MAQAPMRGQYDMGPGPRRHPRLSYQASPRHSFSPPGFSVRSPANRHEPYHIPRPPRRISSEASLTESSHGPPIPTPQGPVPVFQSLVQASLGSMDHISELPVKTEPSDSDNPDHDPSSASNDIINRDDENTNSSTGTNDQSENQTGDTEGNEEENPDMKVEAISETEFELEITGIEPGRPALPPDTWDPNMSMGMNFDPSQGATGSPSDMTAQQGYSKCIISHCSNETISKVFDYKLRFNIIR